MRLLSAVVTMGLLGAGGCGDFADADKTPPEAMSALLEELNGDFRIYFGNLHAHSRCSDGRGSPEAGFSWARDQARYDFYAITDHAESLTASEWTELGAQADAFTRDGAFVALRGFEWSHRGQGHVNVFDTEDFVSARSKPKLSSFYDWLARQDGIAQLNHPGREPGLFEQLAFRERVNDNIATIETGNRDTGNAEGEFLPHYHAALGRGFWIAPTSNQDNHRLRTNAHRTAIVARSLTRASLLEALRNRRVYSSDDPNLRLTFQLGEEWMGARATASGPTAAFAVLVEDDEPIERVELINRAGRVVAQRAYPHRTLSVTYRPVAAARPGDCFHVKVTGKNELDPGGRSQVAVSAPIWIGP